jgi:glyceraldehyde 3-phosphate dehydrogenase
MAFRVPAVYVSAVNLTCKLQKETTYKEICVMIKRKSEGEMRGILGYCNEPLVSTDFESDSLSPIFDAGARIMLRRSSSSSLGTTTSDLMKHAAAVDVRVAA